jgi:predicted ABC-type ATPase
MSRLIVYAGPNGSGKSTMRDIAGDPVEVTIDPDRIARGLTVSHAGGADVEAGKEAIRLFRAAITAGQSVSLESTLTGATILARMKSARAAGYEVSLYYVALMSADDNVARVAARVANGGHHIPEDVIRRRVTASQDNLPAALALADHGKVFDNSGPLPRHLLTVAHRRVLFEAPSSPEWLGSRMAAIQDSLRGV